MVIVALSLLSERRLISSGVAFVIFASFVSISLFVSGAVTLTVISEDVLLASIGPEWLHVII